MSRTCGKNGRLKIGKENRCPEMGGRAGDEDRECDGRTALREVWNGWEEDAEQHLNIEVGEW